MRCLNLTLFLEIDLKCTFPRSRGRCFGKSPNALDPCWKRSGKGTAACVGLVWAGNFATQSSAGIGLLLNLLERPKQLLKNYSTGFLAAHLDFASGC